MVYNPTKQTQLVGYISIPPSLIKVVTKDEFDKLKNTGAPLLYEGDENFPKIWIRNEIK